MKPEIRYIIDILHYAHTHTNTRHTDGGAYTLYLKCVRVGCDGPKTVCVLGFILLCRPLAMPFRPFKCGMKCDVPYI